MEKIRILYKPDVEDFLFDLVYILFKKDYFSYIENAESYKNNIVDFIENNISTFPVSETPFKLRDFGSSYIFYKSNARTTWFVFFEKQESNYLVINIINNHCKEAKWL